MAVKKSVLEQMSNYELEKYIKPETSFVPEATKIAFEILKTRGRDFSTEEIDAINILINKKEEQPKNIKIHPYQVKSSNFMYYSAALGVLNVLFSLKFLLQNNTIINAIIALSFVCLLGFLIRKGYDWMKFVLLVLFLIGSLNVIPALISDLQYYPINGFISLCEFILQLTALVLLFLVPKDFEKAEININ